jgi:hypothetical protein
VGQQPKIYAQFPRFSPSRRQRLSFTFSKFNGRSNRTKGVSINEMAGMVMDTETQQPIADARVVVEGIEKNITTTARGEYWRLLVPGEYTLQVFAEG